MNNLNNLSNWTIGEISGFYGIFQIFPGDLPKPRCPSHANSKRQRKFELFNPTQPNPSHAKGAAKLEEQHRQGASGAALPRDYITRPVALVQHCSSRGAAQRSSRQVCSSSREAEEHLWHECCNNTIIIDFDSCWNCQIGHISSIMWIDSSSSISFFKFLLRNH